MDKILKFLLKLDEKYKKLISQIMHDIKMDTIESYDCKKLVNQQHMRRIRKGNMRIIFRKDETKNVIINIDRRGNVYQ